MQSNPHSSLNLSYATSFQQASVDDIYVLGADGNLWLEHAVNSNFGQVPPPREQARQAGAAVRIHQGDRERVEGVTGGP